MTTTSAEFDKKYDIVDVPTPPNTLMSGHYKQSFAYTTLHDRLPLTLAAVIDQLINDKEEIVEKFGGDSRKEIDNVVALILKFKHQLQTDKALDCFVNNEPDKEVWNNFINKLLPDSELFFDTCWLHAECYLYRKLSSYFENCRWIKNFDYFAKQKNHALDISVKVMEAVVEATRNLDSSPDTFRRIMKLTLWANRCDLSISAGKEVKPSDNAFEIIDDLDASLIVEDALLAWKCLADAKQQDAVIVDFICDNAGYELFTDFILAEHIIETKLATKVRFNVKPIPWFISDVTPHDFKWTLEYLRNHSSKNLQDVGKKWSKMVENGQFEMTFDYFWTSPYEFYRMQEINPKLYEQIGEAQLLIIKGDLNYRKLIGDFTWEFTEDFDVCLRGFRPTNLVSLRTVKADMICGMKHGKAKELFAKDPGWMLTGDYGLIQFAK